MSEIDRWIEIAKECNYLPENDLKVRYRCNRFMFGGFQHVVASVVGKMRM